MPKVYWKSVEIGDPIAPLTRQALTRSEIVVFSVNAGELSPLHLDEEFARQAGYGSISAPGLLGMSLATEMVERWLENGRLIGIATRFQKLVWPGDVLTAKGVVVRKYEEAGSARVDCDVWVQNQSSDIVLKGTAVCLIHLDRAAEKRRKGGLPEVHLSVASMPRPIAISAGASKASHQPAEGRQAKPRRAGTGTKAASGAQSGRVQQEKPPAKASRSGSNAAKPAGQRAAAAAGSKKSMAAMVRTAATAGRKAIARAVAKGVKQSSSEAKDKAKGSKKAPRAKAPKAKAFPKSKAPKAKASPKAKAPKAKASPKSKAPKAKASPKAKGAKKPAKRSTTARAGAGKKAKKK